MLIKPPLAKIAESQLLYERLLQNFKINYGNVAGKKNVITFIKMTQLGLVSADRENVGQGHIWQSNVSALSNRFEPSVLREWWRRDRNFGVCEQALISLP